MIVPNTSSNLYVAVLGDEDDTESVNSGIELIPIVAWNVVDKIPYEAWPICAGDWSPNPDRGVIYIYDNRTIQWRTLDGEYWGAGRASLREKMVK